MDVSGGILANLDAGYSCRHDEDLHFHVWARKLMNHSVAAKLAGLVAGRVKL
jgi:hypothetical protein